MNELDYLYEECPFAMSALEAVLQGDMKTARRKFLLALARQRAETGALSWINHPEYVTYTVSGDHVIAEYRGQKYEIPVHDLHEIVDEFFGM